ncbi:6-phosphogluconolactonase [Algisphaera agarilytica]|uniref:6-phosphogluconolactonase n=1 Tax=Algisphaera agarilytica TaxID=1385975 RepID=A0A7X0H8D0_9BACT|nr:6-phosphogluconolactonase [Algisphaera agarilytica]MBB6430993.1 6-phosphogluconolactonase [Algisphaera agarilytica]
MIKLPGTVVVKPDTEALFEKLGADLLHSAEVAVEKRGVFHLALSGGGTPEPFYVRLVTDPLFRGIPWAQTHIWIVDERCVPEDHEKSNIKMIREAMTDHAGIPASQVHAMPVLADDPAAEYEATLAEAFGITDAPSDSNHPVLDFILLGMGGDCHTASLFPESPALHSTRWIDTNDGEKVVPPPRVTMTYPLINAARHVGVLAVGVGKTAALQSVADQAASGSPDIEQIPISGIAPKSSDLIWYLDQAAAG